MKNLITFFLSLFFTLLALLYLGGAAIYHTANPGQWTDAGQVIFYIAALMALILALVETLLKANR